MNENSNEIPKHAEQSSTPDIKIDLEKAPNLETDQVSGRPLEATTETVLETPTQVTSSQALSPEQILQQGNPDMVSEPRSLDTEAQIETINGIFERGGSPSKDQNLGTLGSEMVEELDNLSSQS